MAHDPKNLEMTADELAALASTKESRSQVKALLKGPKLRTVREVVLYEYDLTGWKGSGPLTLDALISVLTEMGLHLRMTPEEVTAYAGEEPTVPTVESAPDPAGIAKPATESSATNDDASTRAPSLEELLGDDLHLSIVLTLLMAAKIWCASVGLYPDDGKAIVCCLIEEVSNHFQTDSKERRMLNLLAHAAMVEFSKDNYDQFNPDEVAAAIDVFCEYLNGKKLPTS